MSGMILRGRRAPLRTCDKCGAQRPIDAMRVIAGRFICDEHDHYIAPEVLNQAKLHTFKPRPLKQAKPFSPRDTYENAEWILLEHLAANYRWDSVLYNPGVFGRQANDGFAVSGITGGSSGALGAGWTCVYLYELIAEDERPLRMINRAKAILKDAADWLLTRIRAYPGALNGLTSADLGWGSFHQDGTTSGTVSTNTFHVAAAGLGLLRAYQIHGDARYLDAARATVWHCRNVQCGDKLASGFSSSDSAGASVFKFGAFTHRTGSAGGFDHRYHPATLTALELYQAFLDAIGDETIGSSDTSGLFNQSRAIAVSAAIAEARAFWLNGCMDATRSVVTNGLSSATPFDSFNAFPASKSFLTGTGSWRYADAEAATGTTIDGLGWALALRALRAVDGDSSVVTALFDWLMTFTSSAANELPAKYSDKAFYDNSLGTFDPTTAATFTMLVRSGGVDVTTCSGATYHLGATGAVAALYSTRQAPRFKDLKDRLNMPSPASANGERDSEHHYLATMGRCGLSFQARTGSVSVGVTTRADTYAAALAGLIYRQAPKASTLQGHA